MSHATCIVSVLFIQIGTQKSTDTKTKKAILQLKAEKNSQQLLCTINEQNVSEIKYHFLRSIGI